MEICQLCPCCVKCQEGAENVIHVACQSVHLLIVSVVLPQRWFKEMHNNQKVSSKYVIGARNVLHDFFCHLRRQNEEDIRNMKRQTVQTSVAVVLLEFNMFSMSSTHGLLQSLLSGWGVPNLPRTRSQNHQLLPTASSELGIAHDLVAFVSKSAVHLFPRESN